MHLTDLPLFCAESLEPRRLLSAAIESDVLVATATAGNDAIELRRSGADDVVITIWSGSATPASRQTFDMDDFDGVLLDAGGGNDDIYFNGAGIVPNVTMIGGEGNDLFYGGAAAESIAGGDGNDTLWGLGGAETLNGGNGDDVIHYDGTGGSDSVDGGLDYDTILTPGTSAGFVTITGATATATATGGDDRIESRSFSKDTGTADEFPVTSIFINGSTRELDPRKIDSINLFGGAGRDSFYFQFANLTDYQDPDITAYGEDGNDVFIADEGQIDARVFGGAGDDQTGVTDISIGVLGFVDGGSGIDTVTVEFDTNIDLRNQLNTENVVAEGGIAYGNELNNRIEFTIDGGVIHGGGGNDTLISGFDSTELHGDAGNDLLVLRVDRSIVDGGAGTDTVQGSGNVEDEIINVEGAPPPTAEIDGQLLIVGTPLSDVIELRRVGFDDLQVTIWVNGESAPSLRKVFDLDDFTRIHVSGHAGNDRIYVADGAFIPGLVMHGNAGNDTITGSSADDGILGGAGSDQLFGIAGNDLFDGSDRTIDFQPNPTPDTINGGSGNDTAFIDVGIDSTTNVESVSQYEYET